MPELIPVLTQDEIQKSIAQVAQKISSDYRGRELVLIGILKGAFIFLSDLARQLSIPVKIDFMQVASYGDQTSTSGKIRLLRDVQLSVEKQDVLVVEDIVDTGLTLNFIIEHLKALGPESVKVCTLIDKFERRRKDVRIDYACHRIEKGFLVGYGLDCAENYRHLPEVYEYKTDTVE